nr:ionotropic receptor 25a [Onthophagus taurus]
MYPVEVEYEENRIYENVCQGIYQGGNLAIDITWAGGEDIKTITNIVGIPYIKIDISIGLFIELLDKYLDQRNATDVAMLFQDSNRLDEALYYWVLSDKPRLILMDVLNKTTIEHLKSIRPMPSFYAILTTSAALPPLLNLAVESGLASLIERWNIVLLDFSNANLDDLSSHESLTILSLDKSLCCSLLNTPNCQCPSDFIIQKELNVYPIKPECNSTLDTNVLEEFNDHLSSELQQKNFITKTNDTLRLILKGEFYSVRDESVEKLGSYDEVSGVSWEHSEGPLKIKRYFRIGITHAIPWAYKKFTKNGEFVWEGYCVDFAEKLSQLMDFKYDLVEPKQGSFGVKNKNGVWDGLVGDLQTGETDLAIAAIVMTADREEVVDFVPPYFDQSGISIVMRKPIVKTSLFKFMTVLKLEVWLSIVAALTVTGFLIWFLDKYSPYSGQNNKEKYPYPCREFTLKESFWFALTSFTPQGGGEAPKSLSGRALVAAYWLFVVLMLATFTANLAAFLTVERMQTPVQSLDQLAKQSRINYTVVESSDTHEYFINMKNAEDTLYRLWKELTLNASTDGTQYRVWDYPVREQYGHILLAINDSIPVKTAAEGFKKVNERTDADFAFIHDSAEIKYEISKNCNFTEIGEVFAEKPYAIAVQQGSYITDELSRQILTLQKDRFFDYLQSKYWNNSLRTECEDNEDNEGITLESLGGVFIATLFGLALAMLTLIGEVIYYRRKRKNRKVTDISKKKGIKTISVNPKPNVITFGSSFKQRKPNINRLSPTTTQALWDSLGKADHDKPPHQFTN